MNRQLINRYLPALIGGSLYALGFPSKLIPHCFLFTLLGTGLFLSSIQMFKEGGALKEDLKKFFLFSLTYYLTGYYWIPHTLEVFGNIPAPFSNILGIIFSLIILPHYFVVFLGLHWSAQKWPNLISQLKTPAFLALIMCLGEYFIPQQFPAHLGHSWLSLAPYLGLAPFGGYLLFSYISYFLIFHCLKAWQQKSYRSLIYPVSLFILFLAINIAFPLKRPEVTHNLNIRLVQANIGNWLKLTSETGEELSMNKVFKRYHKLSTKPTPTGGPIDLIIWPETAYPNILNSESMRVAIANVPSLIKDIIFEMDTQLFTGGYDMAKVNARSNFESDYNSGFLFGKDGLLKDTYHKIKLIPFGESLPLGPLNSLLSKVITNMAFFAKGTNYTLFQLKNDLRFINLICYEVLFPEFVRTFLKANKKRPHFMINLTNDSWYGDTAEPYQHLYLAKWRAIEFQLPIIRVTNTGLTTIMFEDGSRTKDLGLFRSNSGDFQLPLGQGKATFYEQWGILLTLLLGSVLTFIEYYCRKRVKS